MIHIQQEGTWTTLNEFDELRLLKGFKNKIDPSKSRFDHAIGFYTKKEPVHCGLTNCNHPHNKGVVIKFINGDITNIGHICGKKHYGVEFSDSHRSINQSYDDHVNKQTIDSFNLRNPTFIDDFETLKQKVKHLNLYEKCASLIKGKYKDSPVPEPVREKLSNMIANRSLSLNVMKKIKKGYMDDGVVHDPVYSEIHVGDIKGLDYLFEENRRHILINDIDSSVRCIGSISKNSDSEHLKEAANLCGSIINLVEHHSNIIGLGFDLLKCTNLKLLTEIELNPKEKKQLNRLINQIAIE